MNQKIMVGCMCVIMTMLLMTGLIYQLNQSEDPETFRAGLSINNCTGYNNNTAYDMEVQIYIHGKSNWDVMHLQISNGSQKDVVIEWEDDLVNVLVVYDLHDGDNKKVDIYHLEPQEWRTILII